jgi:hypothetical protein
MYINFVLLDVIEICISNMPAGGSPAPAMQQV